MLQVDGSSVVDDDDEPLMITSDSEDSSQSPARNVPNVTAAGDEIPDIWDGFDEGCAGVFVYEQDPVVSPPKVAIHRSI